MLVLVADARATCETLRETTEEVSLMLGAERQKFIRNDESSACSATALRVPGKWFLLEPPNWQCAGKNMALLQPLHSYAQQALLRTLLERGCAEAPRSKPSLKAAVLKEAGSNFRKVSLRCEKSVLDYQRSTLYCNDKARNKSTRKQH